MSATQPSNDERPEGDHHASVSRRVTDRAQARLDKLQEWTAKSRRAAPALDLLWEFGHRFRQRNGTVLVGHLAYRFFIWLAPMLLVMAAGLGFAASDELNLVQYASDLGVSEDDAADAAEQAQTGRVQALVIGLPALAIATWSLIRGVHYAFAQIWGMEITPRARVLRQVGYFIVAALLIFLLYAAIASLQRQGVVLAVAGVAGSVLMTAAALWAICWVMPRRTTRWLDLLPGPILGAVGISALQVFIALYLPARIASASAVYGALGVALGVLFYMFLLAYLLVSVAFINTVWTDRAQIIAGRPWVVDPDAVPRWLQPSARWVARHPSPASDHDEDPAADDPPERSR